MDGVLDQYLEILDYNIIEEIVKDSFNILALPTAILHKGSTIDRVRINGKYHKDIDRNSFQLFTNSKELSYISDATILTKRKDFGRANRPEQSIFYGSLESTLITLPRATAYFESPNSINEIAERKDVIEIFTVSKWRVKRNIILAEIVFSRDSIRANPDIRLSFNRQFNRLPVFQRQAYLKQLIYYSEQFSKKVEYNWQYKVSCAYSNILYKTNLIGGIAYPSVDSSLQGHNVALLPSTVDKFLTLDKVALFETYNDTVNGITIKPLKMALDINNKTGEIGAWTELSSSGRILLPNS